jgi:hypothetical protein
MRARKYDEKGEPLEHPEETLTRRIHIWAQTWRRCPKKGCRRSRRCLRFHDCAGVPKGNYWPTAWEKRLIWDPFRAAMRAYPAGAPKGNGVSSRPSEAKPSASRDPEP